MMGYHSGDVFWYKIGKDFYGAIVLCFLPEISLYFIAISDLIYPKGKKPAKEEILASNLYTAAWFDVLSLLPPNRVHRVGVSEVYDSFQNRAGLRSFEDGSFIVKNVGQAKTWKHQFRSYVINNRKMEETLFAKKFPVTWINMAR